MCFPWHRLYLISRCRVCRFRKGLYFINSRRSVVFFLFLVVTYREGGLPSFRASVHSRMMISRGIGYLTQFQVRVPQIQILGLNVVRSCPKVVVEDVVVVRPRVLVVLGPQR